MALFDARNKGKGSAQLESSCLLVFFRSEHQELLGSSTSGYELISVGTLRLVLFPLVGFHESSSEDSAYILRKQIL